GGLWEIFPVRRYDARTARVRLRAGARATSPEPARLARQGHPDEPTRRRCLGRPPVPSLARHDERGGPPEGRRPVGNDPVVTATIGESLAGATERLRAAGSHPARLHAELPLRL